MRINRNILVIAVLSSLLIGCSRDEGPDSTASTTRPAAGQDAQGGAMAAAAVEPAATQPTASALFVDQHEEWFPPAMLRVRQHGEQVVARLYSDDPEDVLTGKQTCNSYDFQMPLPQISQVTEISRAVWIARAKSSDRVDTPYGIFLRNRQEVLQPMDATIRFRGKAPQVSVFIDGTFWMFHINDDSSGAPPTMVQVKGALLATVPAK
jgi:hypothetical protein